MNGNKSKYVQRLNAVNRDPYDRVIWDSIDRPIRPLVFELARIGMIPKFSCCGFTYPEETLDEPKTHHGSKAYVFFFVRNTKEAIENFNTLKKQILTAHWNMRIPFSNIIELFSFDCVPSNMYEKKDGINESIHQYEGLVLKIQTITYLIQEFIKTYCDPIEIIDGNKWHRENNPEWQVTPKKNFSIGVKEYYKTYGKVLNPFSDLMDGAVNQLELKQLIPQDIMTHGFIPNNLR